MTVAMVVDKEPRTVSVPEDLKIALASCNAAELAFERLAYSHRKEYVDWIIGAKRPDTRERRIHKTVEMLVSGARLKG